MLPAGVYLIKQWRHASGTGRLGLEEPNLLVRRSTREFVIGGSSVCTSFHFHRGMGYFCPCDEIVGE